MIDKYTGQVAYAVMSFGGFLGMGESYHPLPWKTLTYDTRLGGYVVDIDRNRLEGAPSYTARELPDWSDRTYTGRIDRYWDAAHLTRPKVARVAPTVGATLFSLRLWR